jgi:putative ABC transport system ATP-binding protein
MKTKHVIETRDVERRFAERDVLRGITFGIAPGERVALLGPSGCGKTTLLQILGLLDRPTKGTLLVEGDDAGAWSDTERATVRLLRFGFVFQNAQLLEHLSVRDNVALPAWRQGGDRASALASADRWLERLGLDARKDARAKSLSAGEAQRAALARALVNRPALVLADEPTGNLDTASARAVLDALFGPAEDDGVAVLVVTHDLAVASRADRSLRMEDGRLE